MVQDAETPINDEGAAGNPPIPIDLKHARRDPGARTGGGIGEAGDPSFTLMSIQKQDLCICTDGNNGKEQAMTEQKEPGKQEGKAPWSVEGLSMEGQEVTVRLRINSPADLAALLAALTPAEVA